MINRYQSFLTTIWLLFIAVTTVKAQVQVIKGFVVNAQKNPLPYATVQLKSQSDTTVYRSALCDEKGAFILTDVKAGNYNVTIGMVGFEKLYQAIVVANMADKTTNLGIFELKASPQILQTVTIKDETPHVERLIDKTVVNVDQNITNTGTTVLELMRKLPGVQVAADGQLSLTGKTGVNVFIDGKPTYLSTDDLSALLNSMSSSTVQRVEIMTNPSARYDAAGNAGIINIVKKRNRKEGFSGNANGSFGQSYYGSYNGGLTLNYKTANYNLYLNNSFVYKKNFGSKDVTANIFNGNNKLQAEQISNNKDIGASKAYTPSVGFDVNLSKSTTLSVTGNASLRISDHKTISIMNVFDGNGIKTNNEDFTAVNNDRPYNYTVGFSLKHQFDTLGKQFSIDLDGSTYQNKPKQYNATLLNDVTDNFISNSDVFLNQNRQLNIYAAKSDYTQPLSNNGLFEAGFKFSYVKINNNNTFYNMTNGQSIVDTSQSSYSLNSENINAAYININQVYGKFTMQTGLRAEQTVSEGRELFARQMVHQNYFQLFPTLFLDDKFNDKNSLILKLGRRIERVDYHELVPFRIPQTPTLYFQGNPNLKPQLTWHAEITYSWQQEFFMSFGYDIDHNYIRTFPYLDSNRVTSTRRPTNVQGARSWSIDLNFTKKTTSWWTTDNTLSVYQNSFNGQAAGFSLNNKGIPSVYVTLNNSFTINPGLIAEADFEYESKRQFVNSTYGAYSLLSIGVKKQVMHGKGALSINFNNIFQSEDRYVIDRYQNLNLYTYFHFYTREAKISFSYRFGSSNGLKLRKEKGLTEEQNRAAY